MKHKKTLCYRNEGLVADVAKDTTTKHPFIMVIFSYNEHVKKYIMSII